MPVALRPPSGCPPLSKVEAEEDELASEGSVSTDAGGEGGGGSSANTMSAIYKGIVSNGASKSKKGLKIDTAKER